MNDDYNKRKEKRLKLSLKKRNDVVIPETDVVNYSDRSASVAVEDAKPEVRRAAGGSPSSRVKGGPRALPISTLRNLGNTCYLSSVFQALRWIGGKFNGRLHDKVTQTPSNERKKQRIRNGKRKEKFLQGGNDDDDNYEICLQIHRLFQEMHRMECEDGSEEEKKKSERTADPSQLLSTLRKIDERYKGNEQHDAHELLSTILHAIETACNATKEGTTERMRTRKRTKEKKEDTSLFYGKMVFRTKCVECEDSLKTEDLFWDIPFSLTMSTRDDQCIRDENKFWCEGCVHYNEAYRCTHFVRLPTYLFVRMEQSVMTSTTSDFHKGTGTVDVPLELPCLLESCSKPCSSGQHKYRLKSVICHTGATYSSGHYTTYVRRETTTNVRYTSQKRTRQTSRKEKHSDEVVKCCGVESLKGLDDDDQQLKWLYFDDDKVSAFNCLPKFDIEYSTVVPYLLLYSNSSENTN